MAGEIASGLYPYIAAAVVHLFYSLFPSSFSFHVGLQLSLLYTPIVYPEYATIVYLVSSPHCSLTVQPG